MANTYEKIDDNTIERTKQDPQPAPLKQRFGDRAFLEKQLIDIQAQWDFQVDSINRARQAEIDEVKEVLAEMDKAGIKVAEQTEVGE